MDEDDPLTGDTSIWPVLILLILFVGGFLAEVFWVTDTPEDYQPCVDYGHYAADVDC